MLVAMLPTRSGTVEPFDPKIMIVQHQTWSIVRIEHGNGYRAGVYSAPFLGRRYSLYPVATCFVF